MLRCNFGFKLCPYFCSTYSAEFATWIRLVLAIPLAYFVDDFFTVGSTLDEAQLRLAKIIAFFHLIGLGCEMAKCGISQRQVYLGVLIDSISMRVSFDADNARAFHAELSSLYPLLLARRHISHAASRRVAGKLEWFSQVLQLGKLHSQSWWWFSVHGYRLDRKLFGCLLADTLFWLHTLARWADGTTASEFPILSAAELQADPGRILVVVSDASGDDGFGYYYGGLDDSTHRFHSQRWGVNDPLTGGLTFETSHHGELASLSHFLAHTPRRDCLLIWVTDSSSGAFSINKGKCNATISRPLLTSIYTACDTKGLQLVAAWVPRTHNHVADYLSHLSTLLHRPTTSGTLAGGEILFEASEQDRHD
jgi:hypothetical protein